MGAYERGIHSDSDEGAIDLGLVVTDDGLGVALDAPGIGQLRASFDLLDGGATRLTALSREGVPVLGLTDHARIVELETAVETQEAELDRAKARIGELEALLAEHDAEAERRLAQAQSALGATQASLDATDARSHQAEDQLRSSRQALADTDARLKRTRDELQASKAAFTETELKLHTARGELTAAKAALEDAQTRHKQSQAELAATKKTLAEVEGRQRRLETQASLEKEEFDARSGAQAAELADVSARLQQAEELRQVQDQMLEQSRAELTRTLEEREALEQRATTNEVERDEALRKLQQSEDSRQSELERLGAELADARIAHAEALATEQASLGDQLTSEKTRADGLEKALAEEKRVSERRRAELEEEKSRRDEMVRDLAYIQSQVADLSSTKGALVTRIKAMSERETKRQRTTSEFGAALRTAEVVAADTKASAKRTEARAAKLEDQVRGMQQEILELRGRAEVAENSVLMLGEQLTKTTKERDALKIDVAFFQKQIGAMQRAAAATKPKK
ncbi:MAG: hypothetical protein JNK82_18795 [Myxococcaceae bacterium]|nr:hypothetical protein [Myxococcaceae bacterium]